MGEDGALDRLRAEHCGMFLMNNAVLCSKRWCCPVLYSYCHFCGAEVPIHLPRMVYIHVCLREGTCEPFPIPFIDYGSIDLDRLTEDWRQVHSVRYEDGHEDI